MNFVGKFDAKLPVDGSGSSPDAHHHVDSVSEHAPSDAIIVPDADLLFNGDFKQSGVDLILSRDDHELVVHDYFKGEKRAALASPDGAHLTGDIVNALAGHVQYAQADGSAGAGQVIGHVTKLAGTAIAIRNGVSIVLNMGDNVEKGDVVQSGSDSTLGVTFIDGTVFGLSSNARMVLNEMVYDPNGSNNSSLISLVAGTISFVAGQTAKHGDMKIDTPVATMGIRGTAVLVEIDFDVPGQNGTPEAKFQVLVEPDGSTGSYILFDKSTLAPIAVVDKAGQQVHISNNNVSFSDSPLSPELQKLVTDVFALKFSDNTNPRTLNHFTDTLTPQQTWLPVQFANGEAPAVVHVTITPIASANGPSVPPPTAIPHINQPPVVTTLDKALVERGGLTGNSTVDTASGTISFADINLGDRPTAKATFSSFSYQNAQHHNIALNGQQLADVKALEVPLLVVQAPGNTSNGTATWTYTVPDKAFDFLAAGETLTLTYMAEVDSNYAAGNLATLVPFTVTITGTNDAPVISTGPEKVAFVNVGTGTTGPNLPPAGPTTNKLTFKDPDLTDTHTVATHLTAATLSGNDVPTLDMQALETKFPRPMGVFDSALSAEVTTDSSGTGTGTITWTLADISSYYADIVPAGETLTLTYTVTVKDSQGATSSQKVTVTIAGSDAPAVVWVETTADAPTDTAPGDWNGAHNWETGTVPTANDDVIIITNQLQGQTPLYPVTIKAEDAPAVAHSLTMNDYDTLFTNSPTLINHGTLTVGAGGIGLSADAILENFGTLSVGGPLKMLQESSLQNHGLIILAQGGDFNDSGSFTDSNGTIHSGSVTNSGTLEVAGGTLDVEVAIANSGGTIQIDDGATLKLNGAAIDGGIIINNSTIDITGNSKIDDGATLNNGFMTVESGMKLTLDNVTVNGTVFHDLVTGGTIQIDSGDTLTFNGATVDGGTLNIFGKLDSTGISFITGATIVNAGHIDVISGTLTIDPAPVTNTGTIEVQHDSTLVLSDETITNSVTTAGITTKGIIQVDATDPAHFSTLDLEGSTIHGGTLIISGELDSTGDSFINGATITNTGTIDVTGGTLTIDATSTIDNTGGTLETNGGHLIIDAAIVGSLEIKGGAVLELGSSLANAYSHAAVTFEPGATGTLKLDHSETFSGTVAGLDDNTIDLGDIAYGSNPTVSYAGNASGGILSVFVGGVDVSNINLTGDYLGVHWTLADDGSSQHGTDVMEAPGAVAGLDPNGNAIQGVALTASITDGGQTVSGASYDWQVSHDGGKTWVDANGANGLPSYTPVEADEGQSLRVALSFTDYSGEPETGFVSAGLVQESLTDDLVATLDSTTAQQGVTMHVLGVKDGGVTVTTGLSYAWQDSSDNGLTWVTVGTHSSYTPGESDEGKLMQLVVTYADLSGSESSTYSLGMPNDLTATLDSTTAQQGLAIHVTGVKDGGANVWSGVSYAWQVSSDNGQHWTTVGTHSSFTPVAANDGETLQVIVTYADSEENESATYSLGTVAPAKEWLGGNHDWQAASHWATSGAPASSDNAVVDAIGIYTRKTDHDAAAHSLVVNDFGATVEVVEGNALTLGGNVTIEAGELQIDSGATLKDVATSASITGVFIDNGTIEAAGGKLEIASAVHFGEGTFKIDAGATLQFDHADANNVVFAGSGELILKDPAHFSGTIFDSGGSMTSADVVDVAGFDTSATVSYSGTTSHGIVTISEADHTSVHLKVGANSTHWSAPVSDGDGGILIHDPPASTSTIVASAPNQILTGNAAGDTFAFNFAGVGHTTVTDFHPVTDMLQFSSDLFANLQTALNATHDDGHGNTVIALDAHDTIALNGIVKAQLHASDFHFV